MNRTLAEKRHNDWTKAIRKMKICNNYDIQYYDNLHQYSKNKIHCSCPMCSAKTSKVSISSGSYHRQGANYSIRDLRRIEEMNDSLKETA